MKVLKFPSVTTPWRIVVSLDGKRKSLYFANRGDADKKLREIKKRGVGCLRTVDETKTAIEVERDSRHWQYLAEEYSLTAAQIAEALQRYVDGLKLKAGTVRDAVEDFYAYRLAEVKAGRLSDRTVESDKSRLVHLVRQYGHSRMTELDEHLLTEFVHSFGRNSRSIYKTLALFLKWVTNKKDPYLQVNPFAKVEAKIFGSFGVNNEFYSVPVFRRMLRIAAGLEPVNLGETPTREFIDLLPVFVLGGFAGLRASEATRTGVDEEVVRWTDLHFDGVTRPHLYVREEVAKKTNRESGDARPVDFTNAVEALKSWLALCPRYDGNPFIVAWGEAKIGTLKAAFSKTTGIKFTDNGFRNSFGTYLFSYAADTTDRQQNIADIPGLGYVAKQMGTSENIARRHYVQSLPTGAGAAWYASRPFEIVEAGKEAVA